MAISLVPAWNPLDLPGSLKDLLVGMINYMTNLFESVIIHPPRFSDSGGLPSLYGVGNQLAYYAASWMVFFCVVMFLLFFRKGERATRSIIYYFIVQALLPLWVGIVNQMRDFGDSLCRIAALISTEIPQGASTGLPIIDDVGWYILSLMQVLGWGAWLVVTVTGYDFFIVALKLWMPLAFVMSSLGKRTRAVSNMILSLGLVATIVGRPWAIFFIELGRWAVANLPGGTNGFIQMAVVSFSYIAALISQVTMLFLCYKVVSSIEGFIGAKVRGATETLIKKTVTVDLKKRRERNGPAAVPIVIPLRTQMAREAKSQAGRQALQAAGRGGTKVVAAGLAAVGQPAAGAKVYAAGSAYFGKRPSARPSPSGLMSIPPPTGRPVSRSRTSPHGRTGLSSRKPGGRTRTGTKL